MIKIDTRTTKNKNIYEEESTNTLYYELELGEVIDRLYNKDTCADDLKSNNDKNIIICNNNDEKEYKSTIDYERTCTNNGRGKHT